MARKIKLTISGRSTETDAPTVEDLLDQVRDYFAILESVEGAISGESGSAIHWRVVGAAKNSPLRLEIAPYPKVYATNIDNRVEITVRATALGLSLLQGGAERPDFFTDAALGRAHKLFERVTNGLDLTEVDHGPNLPDIRITNLGARLAADNIKAVLTPVAKPYKEMGSVEGYIRSVESDAWRRPILRVQHRLTGDELKCLVSGPALEVVQGYEIKEVWRHRRVVVSGIIYYKSVSRIDHIEVTNVRFLRDRTQLPSADDILDENFTGGVRSEDYLENLRNGNLS